MEGILALGHFCETHGPCVVLSTQRCKGDPEQGPHSLTVPWCEACQSLELDQALVSRDEYCIYVTTRTPLQQDLAFLLKQATVRSLSCEQEGTLYFGDNERGHVISHSFTVHDSLARGFLRKYTILMLMRDKLHLLNKWTFLLKHIKDIAGILNEYSAKVNEEEQLQRPQRSVRQAQNQPNNTGRSLSQLTGKPAIYAHLHLWFAWLLGCQIIVEKPFSSNLPVPKPSSLLRTLFQEIGQEKFKLIALCILTGKTVDASDPNMLETLYSMLPDPNWVQKADKSKYCKIRKENNWLIDSNVLNPGKTSTLQNEIENALGDARLTESALEPQLTSIVMHWLHIARVLSWCPQMDLKLLQSLNVQKHDIPVLIYWTLNCSDCDKHDSIVKSLYNIYGVS
ncbi:PREDICTED: folliculin [Nicrophorus vespilloides]|uniref:Folliculin n=1 Tax=Nicrophorus vespilloides TaxID=110193 RepID=A0ABM1MN65_NICVS|nr:PREDICTED: folliculin [Nicrophorus vespilloides]